MKYLYEEDASWYKNTYKDVNKPANAARSFKLLHEERSEELWILVHGYCGYPGELVRPAEDLFNKGFDVIVPRLPGCGTKSEDFMHTSFKDWLNCVLNVIDTVKEKYKTVNLLGHSLGCSLVTLAAAEKDVNKVVLIAPVFVNTLIDKNKVKLLKFISIFKKTMKTEWKSDPRYHLHYENAPCDDEYLGSQYWSKLFPRQVLSLNEVFDLARNQIFKLKNRILVIIPLEDIGLSVSTYEEMFKEERENIKVITVENGTHYIMYDIDTEAENKAIDSVIEFAEE